MLHAAAALDDPAIASMLLRYGADPNAGDGENETPLHIAAEAGAHRTLVCLLENGAGADGDDMASLISSPRQATAGNAAVRSSLLAPMSTARTRTVSRHFSTLQQIRSIPGASNRSSMLVPAGASTCCVGRWDGSPRGLHPLLRIPPATDANLGRWWLRDMDEYGLHFRERMRVNLAYLERVDAAGGIFLYERDQQRRLVSLLRRHVAPRPTTSSTSSRRSSGVIREATAICSM